MFVVVVVVCCMLCVVCCLLIVVCWLMFGVNSLRMVVCLLFVGLVACACLFGVCLVVRVFVCVCV